MKMQPIVEGHGEVAAVPVLLRRFSTLAQTFSLEINAPIRRRRTDFFDQAKLSRSIRLALRQGGDAILLVVDADDDCPSQQAPQILEWARAESAGRPCAVVMACREYEAWFLASIESMRGNRGIRTDAISHPEPEQPRGAKEQLESRMEHGRSYHETADQPALSDLFDMLPAFRSSRSFRHLVMAFGELVTAMGLQSTDWPPEDWRQPANS